MVINPTLSSPRLGDPLSPYLFILCANVLFLTLTQAQEGKEVRGIKLTSNAPEVNHLLYTNYLLLFFKADLESCVNLKQII